MTLARLTGGSCRVYMNGTWTADSAMMRTSLLWRFGLARRPATSMAKSQSTISRVHAAPKRSTHRTKVTTPSAMTRFDPNSPPPVSRVVVHKHAERIEKLLAKDRLADAMYAVLRADKAEPMLTRMVKRYRHLAAGSRLQMRPSAQMRDGQTRDGQNAGTNAASHRSRGNNTMPSTSVLPPALRTVPLLVLTRARVWNVLLDKLAEYGMYEEVFKIVKLMHRRGAKATADTHTLMFKSCARHLEMQPPFVGVPPEKIEPFTRALNLYHNLERTRAPLNRFQINMLLKCCSRVSDWETLFKVYTGMNRVGTDRRKKFAVDVDEFMVQWRREQRKMKAGLVLRGGDRARAGIATAKDISANAHAQGMAATETDDDDQWLLAKLDSFMRANTSDYDPGEPTANRSKSDLSAIENVPAAELAADKLLHRIRPDTATYSIMISACAARGGDAAFQDALEIWKDAERDAEISRNETKTARAAFLRAQLALQRRKDGQRVKRSYRGSRGDSSASPRQRHDLELDEEEMAVWQEHESLARKMEAELPVIEIDTKLVNSMMLVCRNAEALDVKKRAFEVAAEQMGEAFDWSLFARYHKARTADAKTKNGGDDFFILFPTLNNVAVTPLPTRGKLALPSSKNIQPDANTLSILFSILQTIGAPTSLMTNFYDFFTTSTGPEFRTHRTIKADKVLEVFYLEFLVNKRLYTEAEACFEKLRRSNVKRFTMPPPVDAFAHMIRMCFLKRDADAAKRYWDDMTTWSNRVSTSDLVKTMQELYRPSSKALFNYLRALESGGRHDLIVEQALAISKLIYTLSKGEKNPALWQDRFAVETSRNKDVWRLSMRAIDALKKQTTEDETMRLKWSAPKLRKVKKEIGERLNFSGGTARATTADRDGEGDDADASLELPASTPTTRHTPQWLRKRFREMAKSVKAKSGENDGEQ